MRIVLDDHAFFRKVDFIWESVAGNCELLCVTTNIQRTNSTGSEASARSGTWKRCFQHSVSSTAFRSDYPIQLQPLAYLAARFGIPLQYSVFCSWNTHYASLFGRYNLPQPSINVRGMVQRLRVTKVVWCNVYVTLTLHSKVNFKLN